LLMIAVPITHCAHIAISAHQPPAAHWHTPERPSVVHNCPVPVVCQAMEQQAAAAPLPPWHALSAAQRAAFDARGFLTMRGVLDEASVAAVTRACDAHMDVWGPRTQPGAFPVNYYANRYTPLLSDPALRALVTNPRTLSAVCQLMRSGDVHLTKAQLTFKFSQWGRSRNELVYPDGDGASFRNWHRDLNNFGAFSPLRGVPLLSLRVGFALTDMQQPLSGVTLLVPGSHRLREQLELEEGALDPARYAEPCLAAGDAVLFSSSIYHTPSINTQPWTAKLLLCTYTYRFMRSAMEPPQQAMMEQLSPIEQQLFGKPRFTDYGGRAVARSCGGELGSSNGEEEEALLGAHDDGCPLGTWVAHQAGMGSKEPPMRRITGTLRAHL
jgi:ectoine hydroxylase-related dioxygenase (phytanoyl-CoA dioxygenase family)